jgi:hypothetical protein
MDPLVVVFFLLMLPPIFFQAASAFAYWSFQTGVQVLEQAKCVTSANPKMVFAAGILLGAFLAVTSRKQVLVGLYFALIFIVFL